MSQLAVIDVETTGINPFRHDRVVEMAAVLMTPDGQVVDEFVTLVNPERDVGPTSIHGLTATDVAKAPRFCDVAGALMAVLRRAVVVGGHNVRFDVTFLSLEYQRLGITFPSCPTLDTKKLAGWGSLSDCCANYGLAREGRVHSALGDARDTARLLSRILAESPEMRSLCLEATQVTWPDIALTNTAPMTRETCRNSPVETPRYVQRLVSRLSAVPGQRAEEAGVLDYYALLGQVLEDRVIQDAEAEALVEVAAQWGLSVEQLKSIHTDYLSRLVRAAWADAQVTDSERQELDMVAHLLGFGPLSLEELSRLRNTAEITVPSTAGVRPIGTENWAGKRVCFTGESICTMKGRRLSREDADRLVSEHGLTVQDAVTMKLDVLVVADPNTQSGKAKKARQHGIRIIHEPVFWRTLGIAID